MAVIKGTAQNYQQLFDTIHNGLINNGWTVENTQHSTITEMFADGAFCKNFNTHDKQIRVIYKGVGFLAENPPFIKIRYNYNDNTKKIFIGVVGLIGYDKETQEYNNRTNFLFYNSFDYQDIAYHIVINSRRICWYMRQNIVVQDLYVGFFLPLCKPTEYAYPYYMSASQYSTDLDDNMLTYLYHRSISQNDNSSFTEQDHRGRYNSNKRQGFVVTTSNEWLSVASNSSYNEAQLIKNTRVRDHSQVAHVDYNSSDTYNDYDTAVFLRSFIVEDDLNMLERIYLAVCLDKQTANVLGSLDEVYFLYGEQIPDTIITLPDTSTYKVCITNNYKYDFYVLPNTEI